MTPCPLCTHQADFFIQDKKRAYYLCHHCGLVFAAPNSYVLPSIERQRYGQAQQASKQKPLSQFIFPLLEQIAQQQPNQALTGLNFGRVLDQNSLEQITQAGHTLNQYDPIFSANQDVLHHQYDFVCCYRVFEHFRSPQKEWRLLSQLVRPNGWLAISTPLLSNVQQFKKWHYKNNPTHVSFYQQLTFEYMAANASFTLLFASKDFILMQKASGSDIKRNLI